MKNFIYKVVNALAYYSIHKDKDKSLKPPLIRFYSQKPECGTTFYDKRFISDTGTEFIFPIYSLRYIKVADALVITIDEKDDLIITDASKHFDEKIDSFSPSRHILVRRWEDDSEINEYGTLLPNIDNFNALILSKIEFININVIPNKKSKKKIKQK